MVFVIDLRAGVRNGIADKHPVLRCIRVDTREIALITTEAKRHDSGQTLITNQTSARVALYDE